MRFFLSLPPNYRPLIIQQFREMGGTRFLVNINRAPVPVRALAGQELVDAALVQLRATLKEDLPNTPALRIAFAWPAHGLPDTPSYTFCLSQITQSAWEHCID